MSKSAKNHLSLVFTPCADFPVSAKSLKEKELKLVTPDGSSEPFKLFTKKLDAGHVNGIRLIHKSEERRLISRQLDTEDRILQAHGVSLRIRGTYIGTGTTGFIVTPDINIKTKIPEGDMGMSRGEYEARIDHAGSIDLSAIERKYAKQLKEGTHPDLEEALSLIRQNLPDIVECFLIDAARTARVIGVSSKLLGFDKGKKFVGEMPFDKVRYQIRSAPDDVIEMIVNNGRRELELEPLHVPCEYSIYDGCQKNICRNLDDFEENYAMDFVRSSVQGYANLLDIEIEDAKLSKSGRGFAGLDQLSNSFNTSSRMSVGSGLILNSKPALSIGAGRQLNVPLALKAA